MELNDFQLSLISETHIKYSTTGNKFMIFHKICCQYNICLAPSSPSKVTKFSFKDNLSPNSSGAFKSCLVYPNGLWHVSIVFCFGPPGLRQSLSLSVIGINVSVSTDSVSGWKVTTAENSHLNLCIFTCW